MDDRIKCPYYNQCHIGALWREAKNGAIIREIYCMDEPRSCGTNQRLSGGVDSASNEEGSVHYYTIQAEEDIETSLNEIRQKHGALSQFVVGAERETTMAGKAILTLFLRFDPTVKIEGEPELVEQFAARFAELTAG